MTAEHEIQSRILVAVSQHRCTIFRSNVGKVKTDDGRWFDTGLPKGHPDLYCFKWSNGKICYIEVKNEKGRLRQDQIHFHKMLMKHHIIHCCARSVNDAIKTINPCYKKVYRFYDKKTGYALGDVLVLANELIPKDQYTLIDPNN